MRKYFVGAAASIGALLLCMGSTFAAGAPAPAAPSIADGFVSIAVGGATVTTDFPGHSESDNGVSLEGAASGEYNYTTTLGVPFYPNVTVGWDASPRTTQSLPFVPGSYPWIPVWDPTPAEFEGGLRRAAQFLDDHPYTHPMITINAWNEWTEGSSLLPDTVNGLGFLEAIRTVFGTRAD